jgi:thiol:disulfide interchange protein
MILSAKTKNILLAPFAISHIMQRFWLPGLAGFLLFAVGMWQRVTWLKIAGLVLAAPVIWVYAVVIFVFFPYALFDRVRQRLKNSHRATSGTHPDGESHRNT